LYIGYSITEVAGMLTYRYSCGDSSGRCGSIRGR